MYMMQVMKFSERTCKYEQVRVENAVLCDVNPRLSAGSGRWE